jgi:hypothetical protein
MQDECTTNSCFVMVREVCKYRNKYQSISNLVNYVTLPHVGCLKRLLAAHIAVMRLEVILCQSLGKCISNLVFCVNRENLDKSLTNMFAKTMLANIYVFGSRT